MNRENIERDLEILFINTLGYIIPWKYGNNAYHVYRMFERFFVPTFETVIYLAPDCAYDTANRDLYSKIRLLKTVNVSPLRDSSKVS